MAWFNWLRKRNNLPHRNLSEIKNGCKILFIDDKKFDIVERLKEKEGWKNTTRIKDLDSITQTELQEAHIVLVDIQGVGKKMGCTDGGLGLIVAIKEKYPLKKIIMYSAESQGKVDSFHKASNLVDFRLRKTSTQYEFNSIIEKLAYEAFSLENCVSRIKTILYNEYAMTLSENEIEKKLAKISPEDTSIQTISSVFNIQNAANIAQIIQLFFSIRL